MSYPPALPSLRVPAIVEGGPQVGLPCTLATLHPWGVAPALWVWRARRLAPPMLASLGTLNGMCAILRGLFRQVLDSFLALAAARPC